MISDTDFRQLLDRIKAGDQHAATELVREYEPLIRREVKMRLEDQRLRRVFDTLDVCQSVLASFFVRTAMGEYEFDDPRQLIGLLVKMTRNKVASAARMHHRQKRDQRRVTSYDEASLGVVDASQESPSEIVMEADLLQRFREALRDEPRIMADLREQGRTWEEIAQQLGGTAQARRVQYSRAIERIAEQLGVFDPSDE